MTKNISSAGADFHEAPTTRYRARSRWFSPNVPRLIVDNIKLRREINALRTRMNIIEERIPEQEIIVIRSVSMGQAKKEIKALFGNGQEYYYSDIAKELGLGLKTVVDICREMQENGEIGVA